MGDDGTNNYLNNPLCVDVSIAGWFTCGNTGKYLSFGYGSGYYFVFADIMAYSQEAIHIKAKSATLSSNSVDILSLGSGSTCLGSTNCKASNVLRAVLRTTSNGLSGDYACCVISGEETDPYL